MECANLAPFSATVRAVTGRPVFDLFTLGMHAFQTCIGTRFGRSGSPSERRW
jgi:hypothetical protein